MGLSSYQVWNCPICKFASQYWIFDVCCHKTYDVPFLVVFFLPLLQMLIKAFTAILAVILEAFGVYCEGEFRWNCG